MSNFDSATLTIPCEGCGRYISLSEQSLEAQKRQLCSRCVASWVVPDWTKDAAGK